MTKAKSSIVLVYNHQGQLALQLRSATDEKYPLHWDFSAAGGIEAGESPLQAAQRELAEEIGITSFLEFVTKILYQDQNGKDHLYIYKTTHSGPFTPDQKEVQQVQFFDEIQINQMLKTEKFHPEFPFIWKKLLSKPNTN